MTDEARTGMAATRDDVTFASGDGHCGAWLYRPHGTHQPPIIVMGHGFGAVRELRLDAYAERFAEAGYAVLVFDYRHFGASSGEPRELLDLSRQHEDWRSALSYARSLDGIDKSPVIAWGSSLGGGHVLHTAANDQGLAAVIAQVPHVSGLVATRSLGVRHVSAMALAGLRDQANHLLGRSPYYRQEHRRRRHISRDDRARLARPTAPCPGGEMGSTRRSSRSQNRFVARVLLHMPFYSPGRTAHRITAPTSAQAGEHDQLTPPSASRKVAERIPTKAEFKIYSCGHFDPYLLPHFDGIVSDQLTFLRTYVPL